MSDSPATTILFTGYAPVHFACFRPLYERLVKLPRVQVFLSGGLRTKTEAGTQYDEHGLYGQFKIPQDRILSVEEIQSRDFDVQFGANTNMISPRNVGVRVQIFHGISFRNKAIRRENLGYDFYFVIGPYMHQKFVEAGLFEPDDPRALKIGFPKTDQLVNGERSRSELLKRYQFDGTRPISLYAPTGLKHNSLETMGEEVILRLGASGRYDLLIKPHDHPKNTSIDWYSRLASMENEHIRVSRDPDVIPQLSVADMLITDASSVASEYSLLDRPMVFLDVPKLLAKAGKDTKASFDVDTWGRRGGAIVEQPNTVVQTVADSFRNSGHHAEIRRGMAADLFYNPGRATDHAISWIQDTLLKPGNGSPTGRSRPIETTKGTEGSAQESWSQPETDDPSGW